MQVHESRNIKSLFYQQFLLKMFIHWYLFYTGEPAQKSSVLGTWCQYIAYCYMQYLGNILGRILATYGSNIGGKCALPYILLIYCQVFNRKNIESVANIGGIIDLDIIREMPLPIIFMFYYQKFTSRRYCVRYWVPYIKGDNKNKANLVIRTLRKESFERLTYAAYILSVFWYIYRKHHWRAV